MDDQTAELEQLRLDLEDAEKRLETLRRAIVLRDAAELEVARLATELRHARRKAKEAGWNVGALLARERVKPLCPQPGRNGGGA